MKIICNFFQLNTSVLACTLPKPGKHRGVYHSYNTGTPKTSTPLDDSVLETGISMVKHEVTDSHILCVFDRKIQPSDGQVGKVFPLDEEWYPAWAVGPINDEGFMRRHTRRVSYPTTINCTGISPPPAPVNDETEALLMKLHGVFMMVGWMLCVACSILTPRYLRSHWTSTRFGGVQLWFVVHRALMIIGIVFVIAGLVLILVAKNGELIDVFFLF